VGKISLVQQLYPVGLCYNDQGWKMASKKP